MSLIYKQVYHTCQSKNNEISIYIKVANNLFYSVIRFLLNCLQRIYYQHGTFPYCKENSRETMLFFPLSNISITSFRSYSLRYRNVRFV